MGELGELYSSGVFYRLLICRGGGGRESHVAGVADGCTTPPTPPLPRTPPRRRAAETLSEHGATARKSPRLPSIFPAKAEGIDMKQRERLRSHTCGRFVGNKTQFRSHRCVESRKRGGPGLSRCHPIEEDTPDSSCSTSPRHVDGGAGGRGDRRDGDRPRSRHSA